MGLSADVIAPTSGRATVVLEDRSGSHVRLRTLVEGTVIGEISLYRDEPCTATVVAELGCQVLHLSPSAFDQLCAEDTATAATLHLFVARALGAGSAMRTGPSERYTTEVDHSPPAGRTHFVGNASMPCTDTARNFGPRCARVLLLLSQ